MVSEFRVLSINLTACVYIYIRRVVIYTSCVVAFQTLANATYNFIYAFSVVAVTTVTFSLAVAISPAFAVA